MPSVAIVTQEQAGASVALRATVYRAAKDFTLANAELIAWGPSDQPRHVVLAAQDAQGQPRATLRARMLTSTVEAEQTTACGFRPYPVVDQALLLDRAATVPAVQGHGLNSLLRYHLLRLAVAWRLSHLPGEVVAGSPRTRLLASLGYEFIPPAFSVRDQSADPRRSAGPGQARPGWRLSCSGRAPRPPKQHYPWHGPQPMPPRSASE